MSRIKAVDFAKSVDNSRILLTDTLKSKGIDVDENRNLNYYIQQIEQFPNLEVKDDYTPDSFFTQLEQDYLTDPLRTKNGGEYEYCCFLGLTTQYETSLLTIPVKATYRIITSDGQDILLEDAASKSDYTITWDATKDGLYKFQSGKPARWIKIYTNGSTNDQFCFPCYKDGSSALQYTSPVMFALFDLGSVAINSTSSVSKNTMNKTDIRHIAFGEHVLSIGTSSSSTSSFMQYARFLEAIVSVNPLELYTQIPSNSTVAVGFKKLPKLKLIANSANIMMYCGKILDLSNTDINIAGTLFPTSSYFGSVSSKAILMPEEFTQYGGFGTGLLIKNLFLPKSKVGNKLTIANNSVEELYIPYDFYNSIDFGTNGDRLSKESFTRIADNIRDFRGGETHYISLPEHLQELVNLDDLEKAINKNWTVTFA